MAPRWFTLTSLLHENGAAMSWLEFSNLLVFALLGALLVSLVYAVTGWVRNERHKRDLEKERLLFERERESRLQEESRRHAATSMPRNVHDAPDAHILSFTFDLGPGHGPGDLGYSVLQSLQLIDSMATAHEVERIEVRQLTYRNPLEILLLIWATEAAIAGIVGTAVGVNAAVQRIRRTHSETRAIQASHRALESRAKTEEAVWDTLRAEIQRGNFHTNDLEQAVSAATALRGVEYQPPTEADYRELR